jgi:hypothetical protein
MLFIAKYLFLEQMRLEYKINYIFHLPVEMTDEEMDKFDEQRSLAMSTFSEVSVLCRDAPDTVFAGYPAGRMSG